MQTKSIRTTGTYMIINSVLGLVQTPRWNVTESHSLSVRICVIANATIIFVENVTCFCSSNIYSLAGQTNVYRPISFFVRLSQRTILNINSIVKFDEVSVNEGNHFNSGDGIFVAPVSGIYQFSWTTLTVSSKLAETELRVDNVIKETLHISLGTGIISGTKVVLCKVKKGDHVWIQTSNVYVSNTFVVANANAKSSFTGMLIHEL